MRMFKILIVFLFFMGVLSSCEKEYFTSPPFDPNASVSFANDLQPIFTAKCVASGCHNGAQSPNLLAGQSYANLLDKGLVDTLNPKQSILMIKLNTNMPPGKLPAADINKFLTWITQGAQEN